MTFFEHQHLARRNTRVLVVLYLLAVVGVIIAVDAVIAGVYLWAQAESAPGEAAYRLGDEIRRVPASLLVWGALGTAAVVLLVSLFHTIRLAAGGEAVATMVGARAVDPATKDPLEQRLINVVEEMSIASGVRVPKVYVMDDEAGINAFAAGYEVSNAVVAVTRGTLERLNRDELQGVVAHEFSHILNGDMRLNIRLIGILQGIVFIGAVGEFIMRSVSRGSGKKDGAAAIFVLGLALFLIGAIGLFFARLIKAAVSRQREFLADASSVQFTRNPDAIAGALDQIRLSAEGAAIEGRHAEELSHMYFAQAISTWFSTLFATHPPVDERIRRAHPRFNTGDYRRTRPLPVPAPAAEGEGEGESDDARRRAATQAVLTATVLAGHGAARRGDRGVAWGRSAGESAALVGTLDAEKVDVATRLLAALPEGIRALAHERDGARALLIAMMLAPRAEVMQVQLERLRAQGLEALADAARDTAPKIASLGDEFRLPLVDLALPALKRAEAAARKALVEALGEVIRADRRVTLHEFVVQTLVREQLAPPEKRPAGTHNVTALRGDVVRLLSLVCFAGHGTGPQTETERNAAFTAGIQAMNLGGEAALDASARQLEEVGRSLDALRGLAPLAKAIVVKGLFAAAIHDNTIRVAEAELLRMLGAVLDCPLPPLFDTLPRAS